MSGGKGDLRQVPDLRIGDHVTFSGGTFVVRDVSPMSVVPQRLGLEHERTGGRVEVSADAVEKRVGIDGQP